MKIHRTLKLVKPQPTMVPGDSGVSCCLLLTAVLLGSVLLLVPGAHLGSLLPVICVDGQEANVFTLVYCLLQAIVAGSVAPEPCFAMFCY